MLEQLAEIACGEAGRLTCVSVGVLAVHHVAMMVYVMVYVIMLYVVQSYQQFSLRDWLYGIIYLRFVIVLPSQK